MANSLKKYEEKRLREAFDIFDKDKSGYITFNELKELFISLKLQISDQDIRALLEKMDLNKDNKVSFVEFKSIMKSYLNEEVSDQKIRATFRLIDEDDNGMISCDELHLILLRLGKTFRRDEVEKMISAVDKDGDGFISFNEFKAICKK